MRKIKQELAFFKSHPYRMRVLLMTNLIYGWVLPIIELFIGAYIIRNSSDISLVMVFQLAQGTGIPLTFMINGFLLNRFPIAKLYSLGMLLSGVSMATMMLFHDLTLYGVSLAGLLMGVSYGFFWANRSFLALTNTKDQNRNYYYGLETFFYTISFIVVPFLAGTFITASHRNEWFGGHMNVAYYILTGFVFLLTVLATFLAHRGHFRNPQKRPFLFFSFHRLWKKMLRLAALKGVAQGYIITAPVMLIMKFIGSEGSLGAIQSAGALLSAVLLYFLGRMTTASHRMQIFLAGLLLFTIGSCANAILYSATGVILFVGCLVFARPLLDLAYYPIQLKVIEFVSAKEKRNQFAYIFSHELGLYVGRVFGSGLFIVLARYVDMDIALRYALLVIALVQLLSVFAARSIMHDRAWHEPTVEEKVAVDVLKEPIEL